MPGGGWHDRYRRPAYSAALGGHGRAGQGGAGDPDRGAGADAFNLRALPGDGPALCPRRLPAAVVAVRRAAQAARPTMKESSMSVTEESRESPAMADFTMPT